MAEKPKARSQIIVHWKRITFTHAITKSTDWCIVFEDTLMVTDTAGLEYFYPTGEHMRWEVR